MKLMLMIILIFIMVMLNDSTVNLEKIRRSSSARFLLKIS